LKTIAFACKFQAIHDIFKAKSDSFGHPSRRLASHPLRFQAIGKFLPAQEFMAGNKKACSRQAFLSDSHELSRG
jgi:hypothetical protein